MADPPAAAQDAQAEGGGAEEEETDVRYVQAGIQLHIEAFQIPENKMNVGIEWEEWLEVFEEELQLQKVERVTDKVT